ncbi:MAG: hypothetical protein DBX39_03085 [Bacillota bacterium]|nr:MAG: hypothetical protein DBX39_03085 [Bacillota bacterium]
MQEEERKRKKCLYCGNFEGYYTKGLHCFDRTKQGYCREHDKIVNNQDFCEFWKTSRRRYLVRRRAVSRALYEILTEISAIRQIMQECEDEGKNL